MKFPKPVLASLLGFSIMLTGCRREAPSPAPENVTLLIEDENRILTLGFSEYLAGCIFAAADPSFQEETLLDRKSTRLNSSHPSSSRMPSSA